MAKYKGTKAHDDHFVGTAGVDTFYFNPGYLTSSDSIVGGGGARGDTLEFTAAGTIGTSALANVSQIERIVLAEGINSIVLNDALVSTADHARIQVTGGGRDSIDGSGLTGANAIDVIAGSGSQTLTGGNGADTFVFDAAELNGADIINGGFGIDTLSIKTGGKILTAQLAGVTSIESIVLGDDGFRLFLPESIYYTASIRGLTVTGGAGNDLIDASNLKAGPTGSGTLSLFGGDGDDVLLGSSPNTDLPVGFYPLRNYADGGAGRDTIDLTTWDSATVVYDPNDIHAITSRGLLVVNGAASIDLTHVQDQSLGDLSITRGFVDVDASASQESVTIAGNGSDSISGGAGADVLSNARDITGGAGADTMIGTKDFNGCNFIINTGDFAPGESILGQTGDDKLYVSGRADMTTGTVTGIRFLTLTYGSNGKPGSLIMRSDQVSDLYYISGSGTLTVTVDADRNLVLHDLFGGDPSFVLNALGSRGDDTISIGSGDGLDATAHGGLGNDVLGGGGSLYGDGGNDRIDYSSYGGPSLIDGGNGNDTLTSGGSITLRLANAADQTENDHTTVRGMENIDLSTSQTGTVDCIGSDAVNVLIGGRGVDTLDGAGGNDKIEGGYGNDILTGGAGADKFIWESLGGQDVVTDFAAGEDKLVFVKENEQGNIVFDFAGKQFDTLVDATDRETSVAHADLVIYTASHLNSVNDVNLYLRENGTGLRNEGIFVVAQNDQGHTLLFYGSDASTVNPSWSQIADLGAIAPTALHLTDFSFI